MTDKISLGEIEKNIRNCSKCRLCETATNPVPGEGDGNSELVFIGEAPGFYEDQSGRPFVGRAGKLLEKSLEKISYTRDQVWIGNIIKHRPPDNRDPLPDEISACAPYLTLQLKALQPLLIITLGRYAMNYFYPDGKISRDRGRMISAQGFRIFPVYHPAAALRSNAMMKEFIKDFLKIPIVLKQVKEGKVEVKYDSTSQEDVPDGQLQLKL